MARSLAVLAHEPGAEDLDPDRFARAVELDTMGLPRHATRELQALPFPPASQAEAQLILLEAYERVGAYRRALQLSVVRRPNTAPVGEHAMDRFAYPRGYWSLLNKYGATNRLDPMLVAAVIRQESAFDPAAVSPVGARGLMQLMPKTAARVAAGLGRPPPSARDLEQPAVNIPLGTTYLGQLVTRYDGAIHRAVAAYNAGEDAVAKWDRRFGDSEPDEFVEQITYAETRNYVKSVLRGQRRYRSIYDGRSGVLTVEGTGDRAPSVEASSGGANDPEVLPVDAVAADGSGTAERRPVPRRRSRLRGPR
jgi:soluble lytic murein transglycosylase